MILLFTTLTISHATHFDFYASQCPFDVPACFASSVNIYISVLAKDSDQDLPSLERSRD